MIAEVLPHRDFGKRKASQSAPDRGLASVHWQRWLPGQRSREAESRPVFQIVDIGQRR